MIHVVERSMRAVDERLERMGEAAEEEETQAALEVIQARWEVAYEEAVRLWWRAARELERQTRPQPPRERRLRHLE